MRRSRRGAAGRADGPRVVALAGGVGAARFLAGLVEVFEPTRLTVIVNTADDIERHGLLVSPDVDSVVYRLAGIADEERGWGLGDETWQALAMLRKLGEPAWFQLGDRDLGTHLWRTAERRRGRPLSAVTADQCRALGIRARILPMSDDPVTTRVRCAGLGDLHLQEYFVRERCEPAIEDIRLVGVASARPAPDVLDAIAAADVLVVCPSNPIISIGPILAVPGIRAALAAVPDGVAVSPIIGGRAVKGPAAEMLRWAGFSVDAAGVASLYADIVQAMVLDETDLAVVPAVEALGLHAVPAPTLMDAPGSAARLAAVVLASAGVDSTAGAAA